MEFVAKSKKIKVSIGEQSHEIKCPTLGQREELFTKLKENPEQALGFYAEWFESLGLPKSAFYSLDADDFGDLIEFIVNPKKKQLS